MNDRNELAEALIAGVVTLAVIGLQYLSTDQGLQIELKAKWRQVRHAWDVWTGAVADGEELAEWLAGKDGVVAEAESIARAGE